MNDSNLRELQRRFRASGSVDDEAAWLRARVQAGDLLESRLELAAHCGHQAALDAQSSSPGVGTRSPLRAMGLELPPCWDPEASVRAAVALVGCVLPCLDPLPTRDDRLLDAVQVVEAWLVEPTDERVQRARDLGSQEEAIVEPFWALSGLPTYDLEGWTGAPAHDDAQLRVWRRERIQSEICAVTVLFRALDGVGRAADEAAGTLGICLANASKALRPEADWNETAPEAVEAIAREVVPWALGYSDPVRERVEARKREASGE